MLYIYNSDFRILTTPILSRNPSIFEMCPPNYSPPQLFDKKIKSLARLTHPLNRGPEPREFFSGLKHSYADFIPNEANQK